jgi:hypothetical protein
VYTAITNVTTLKDCQEGEIRWVPIDEILDYKLIGFIKEIMPYIVKNDTFFEGTITHDPSGEILQKYYSYKQ